MLWLWLMLRFKWLDHFIQLQWWCIVGAMLAVVLQSIPPAVVMLETRLLPISKDLRRATALLLQPVMAHPSHDHVHYYRVYWIHSLSHRWPAFVTYSLQLVQMMARGVRLQTPCVSSLARRSLGRASSRLPGPLCPQLATIQCLQVVCPRPCTPPLRVCAQCQPFCHGLFIWSLLVASSLHKSHPALAGGPEQRLGWLACTGTPTLAGSGTAGALVASKQLPPLAVAGGMSGALVVPQPVATAVLNLSVEDVEVERCADKLLAAIPDALLFSTSSHVPIGERRANKREHLLTLGAGFLLGTLST